MAILMIQALEHKEKTRQFDTGNYKGFLGKACTRRYSTDKVQLYMTDSQMFQKVEYGVPAKI